jgi:hypothetical protein
LGESFAIAFACQPEASHGQPFAPAEQAFRERGFYDRLQGRQQWRQHVGILAALRAVRVEVLDYAMA